MHNYKNAKNRDLYILSSITKPSLSVVLDCKQLMVTNTANRPSHERVKHTKTIITNNLSHKYSFVDFEPSGTVAQHLGLQDIWDI